MLVLDTNVLSAIMAPIPPPAVAGWLARQSDESLFTTTISQAEIMSGLAIMAEGRRRRELEATAQAIFTDDFEGRILSFDIAAATAYAGVLAARRRSGRPTPPLDCMIAAIAVARGAAVVTRDVGGFDGCGITLINPWETS